MWRDLPTTIGTNTGDVAAYNGLTRRMGKRDPLGLSGKPMRDDGKRASFKRRVTRIPRNRRASKRRTIDTVYPRLFVTTCPGGPQDRLSVITNSYPGFRDGSVNCVTLFRKVFRMLELNGWGRAIPRDAQRLNVFSPSLRDEQIRAS